MGASPADDKREVDALSVRAALDERWRGDGAVPIYLRYISGEPPIYIAGLTFAPP
jgi:hypothetical protein